MSNKTDLHRQKLIESLFHIYYALTLLYAKEISLKDLVDKREKLEQFALDLSDYTNESR